MSSVGGYCSELRSIATITATMLPVSPFTAIRGVCVWECVCEQWSYTHTHTHWHSSPHTRSAIQCACSMANTMLERRAKFQRKLHAMRMCNSRVRPRPCPLAPSFLNSPFLFFTPCHPLPTPPPPRANCVSLKTARYK